MTLREGTVRYFLKWAHGRGLTGELTKDDVLTDGQATCLSVDGHRLKLPPRLATLVRQLRDQDEPRWTGISISTAERWSQWAKRDWAAYVGQRAADIAAEPEAL